MNNIFLKNGIEATQCYNTTIQKNTFLEKSSSVGYRCYDCTFSDNVFFEGYITISGGEDSTRNFIFNNTFLKGGMSLGHQSHSKIFKNKIFNGIDNVYGIALSESRNNIIDNNSISNTSSVIFINFISGYNEITNNTLISNNEGIVINYLSPGNNLKNNTIIKNNIGISILYSCPETLITENKVESNENYGIYIGQSSTNPSLNGNYLIYNNFFNNTINYFNKVGCGAHVPVFWNIIKTSGTNIVGGQYLGGNYWAKLDGTGFSETCSDLNEDGICDLPYNINGSDFDYLPLTIPHAQNIDNSLTIE